MSNTNDSVFGNVIYSYTRAQAIEDGVLVDLSRLPVIRIFWTQHFACTDTVWNVIERGVEAGGDRDGILQDICWGARCVLSKTKPKQTNLIRFTVTVGGRTHDLKLHCGPGDTPEPVLTLMLAHED